MHSTGRYEYCEKAHIDNHAPAANRGVQKKLAVP
jgi:hypothetical protein